MITVQEYVAEQLIELESKNLADKMGVSASMISAYKKSYKPSLDVAKRVYLADRIVLHPFSEESLKIETRNNDA